MKPTHLRWPHQVLDGVYSLPTRTIPAWWTWYQVNEASIVLKKNTRNLRNKISSNNEVKVATNTKLYFCKGENNN